MTTSASGAGVPVARPRSGPARANTDRRGPLRLLHGVGRSLSHAAHRTGVLWRRHGWGIVFVVAVFAAFLVITVIAGGHLLAAAGR